jgi:hypothetical protein
VEKEGMEKGSWRKEQEGVKQASSPMQTGRLSMSWKWQQPLLVEPAKELAPPNNAASVLPSLLVPMHLVHLWAGWWQLFLLHAALLRGRGRSSGAPGRCKLCLIAVLRSQDIKMQDHYGTLHQGPLLLHPFRLVGGVRKLPPPPLWVVVYRCILVCLLAGLRRDVCPTLVLASLTITSAMGCHLLRPSHLQQYCGTLCLRKMLQAPQLVFL